MNWYIGQKVVCIMPDADGDLKKGQIYTVKAIRSLTGGIKVLEAICTGGYSGYFRRDRFAPIEDFDISELTEILERELVFPPHVEEQKEKI